MEDKKTFGQYVMQQRKKKGLTQKELADQLFITESAVSKWERGLSYPDITLVKSLCDIFAVTEHELLTASEDITFHTNERLAKQYQKLIARYRWILFVLLGIPLLTTFIVNIATEHRLSWFFIVLGAELVVASILLLPSFFEHGRGIVLLSGFTLSLLLLLFICDIYSGGHWLFIAATGSLLFLSAVFLPYVLSHIPLPSNLVSHKTLLYFAVNTFLLLLLLFTVDLSTTGSWFFYPVLPLVLFLLILPWTIMLIIRYGRMNVFFKFSSCFALSALFIFFSNPLISWITQASPEFENVHINFFTFGSYAYGNQIASLVLLALALLFFIPGVFHLLKKNRESK